MVICWGYFSQKIKYFTCTGKINSKGVIAQHSDYFLYIIFLEKSVERVDIKFDWFLICVYFWKFCICVTMGYHHIHPSFPVFNSFMFLQYINFPNPCLLAENTLPCPVSAIRCAWAIHSSTGIVLVTIFSIDNDSPPTLCP